MGGGLEKLLRSCVLLLETIQYILVLKITKFYKSSLNFNSIFNHAELSLLTVQLQTYQVGFPTDQCKILLKSEMSIWSTKHTLTYTYTGNTENKTFTLKQYQLLFSRNCVSKNVAVSVSSSQF
jgi:hypothetical protein